MDNQIYLDEKEKRIMSALYRLKEGPVSKIAKETLINRTTLYSILEKLLAKGLISKLQIEGATVFQPISVKEFQDWFQRQRQEFQKKSQEVLEWLKVQNVSENNSLLSEIKYFEGLEGVKNLYSDSWRNNEAKLIYAITDYKSAYSTMGDFFRKEYFPARIKHQVKIKNLLPESEDGKRDFKTAKSLMREMKFIKLFENLNIEINIYGSKVSIITFDKKTPSGVLIKNAKIASAFKNIFEYLWKSVEHPKNDF